MSFVNFSKIPAKLNVMQDAFATAEANKKQEKPKAKPEIDEAAREGELDHSDPSRSK